MPRRPAPKHKRSKSEDSESELPTSRPLWTGTLGFGLVQIPVRLVTAESHTDISFHQLDKRDMARIRYQRINETTGKKVEWSDVVKGYELSKGEYVIVDDEDFEKASVEATKSIDIQDFVAREEIPPMYFERPYVLVPDRGGAKAYAVLRSAMEKKGRVAIGLVVIRSRQHLCAVMPVGDALVCELLRFDEDLKPLSENAHELPKASAAGSAKETALAEQLIESLAGEWDPSKYKDTYKRDLMKAIEQKAKTGKMPTVRKVKAERTNVTDLLSLLQKSVARPPKKAA